jgi:hypothetical protein
MKPQNVPPTLLAAKTAPLLLLFFGSGCAARICGLVGPVVANTVAGRGYDLVVPGQAEPTRIDLDALEHRLARPDMEQVTRSLRQVGVGSGIGFCGTFAGQAEDLRAWLQGAELNRDADLRLQYLAVLGLNEYRSAEIYAAMMDHPLRFPANVFRGSERRLQQLRETLLWARGE